MSRTDNNFCINDRDDDPDGPHKDKSQDKAEVVVRHLKSLEAEGVPDIYGIDHQSEQQECRNFKDYKRRERVVFECPC
jgi:hypothetical protein